MSDEPNSGAAFALPAPDPAPQPDASSMRAAVARLTAAAGGERTALERLRGELDAMAQVIAAAHTALQAAAIKPDAETDGKAVDAGALLFELQGRLDAMVALATAAAERDATAQRAPPPPEPTPGPYYFELPGDAPAAAAAAEPEPDRVPTVSDVVWQLGRDGDSPASDTDARRETVVASEVSSLGAMVEALTASIPVDDTRSPQDVPAGAAMSEAHVAPQPADIDPPLEAEPAGEAAWPAVVVLPPELVGMVEATPAEAAAAPDTVTASEEPATAMSAPQIVDEAPPAEIVAAANVLAAGQEPAIAETPPEPVIAGEAPPETAAPSDIPAASPEPAIAELPPEPVIASEAPLPEATAAADILATSPDVIATPEPEPAPADKVTPPEAAAVPNTLMVSAEPAMAAPAAEPSQPGGIRSEPEAQPPPTLSTSGARSAATSEAALLSNFARMEAVPFLPVEVGTAVIFQPKPAMPPDAPADMQPTPAPESPAATESPSPAEAAPLAVSPPEAILELTPADIVPTSQTAPAEAPGPGAVAAEPSEVAVELDSFLFEPQTEIDPAEFLLEPWPKPSPAPAPAAEPRLASQPTPASSVAEDPLAPLKAMSDEEKIALFS